MHTYRISVWTGPCVVSSLASWLRGRGETEVTEGTERVYFKLRAQSSQEAHFAGVETARVFSPTFRATDVGATDACASCDGKAAL